jgi:chromosome segregation ATPase
MEMIADGLLIAGALGAALYCRALGQRLNRLKDLDSGLGAAIAALSRQVDELREQLASARSMTGDQTRELVQLTARAEMAAGRLELLLASLHEGGGRKAGQGAKVAERRAALRAAETEAEDDPFEEPYRGREAAS